MDTTSTKRRPPSVRLAAAEAIRTAKADPDLAWLTIEQAAFFLQCGRRSVDTLIAQGRIPHIRVGKMIRIPASALGIGLTKVSS